MLSFLFTSISNSYPILDADASECTCLAITYSSSLFTKGQSAGDFDQWKYPPNVITLTSSYGPPSKKSCYSLPRPQILSTVRYIKVLLWSVLSLRVLFFSQFCVIMKVASCSLFALLACLVHAVPIPHEEVIATESCRMASKGLTFY